MQIVVFYGFKNIPVFRQAPLSIPMGVPEVSKTVQNHHNLGGRFEGGGGNYLVYGYLAVKVQLPIIVIYIIPCELPGLISETAATFRERKLISLPSLLSTLSPSSHYSFRLML